MSGELYQVRQWAEAGSYQVIVHAVEEDAIDLPSPWAGRQEGAAPSTRICSIDVEYANPTLDQPLSCRRNQWYLYDAAGYSYEAEPSGDQWYRARGRPFLGGERLLNPGEAVGDLPGARGVLIFGTPPIAFPPAMEQAFLPHPAMAATFKEQLSDEEMETYVASFFAPGVAELPALFLEEIRRSDGRARAAVAASIRPDGYKDEVQVVAGLSIPLAVLQGAEEQLVNGAYFASLSMPTLWRGAVQLIPGAGHAPHWEQPEQFNALLDAFIADCLG